MNAMTLNYSDLGREALEAIFQLADLLKTTPKRATELYLNHVAKTAMLAPTEEASK